MATIKERKDRVKKAKGTLDKINKIQEKTSAGIKKVRAKAAGLGEKIKARVGGDKTVKAAPKPAADPTQAATRKAAERSALKGAETRARASGVDFNRSGQPRGKVGRTLARAPGVRGVLKGAERVAASPIARGLGRVAAPIVLATEAFDVGSGAIEGFKKTGRFGGEGGALDVARKRSLGESIVNPVSAAGAVFTGRARSFREGMQQAEADLSSRTVGQALAGVDEPGAGLRKRLREEFDAKLAAEAEQDQLPAEQEQPAAVAPGTDVAAPGAGGTARTGLRAAAVNRDFLTPEARAFQTGGGLLRKAGAQFDRENPFGNVLQMGAATKLASEENIANQRFFENQMGLRKSQLAEAELGEKVAAGRSLRRGAAGKAEKEGLQTSLANTSKNFELRREGHTAEADARLDQSFSVASDVNFDPTHPATIETFGNLLGAISKEESGFWDTLGGVLGFREGVSASDLTAPGSPLFTEDTIHRFGIIGNTLQYVDDEGIPRASTEMEELPENVQQKLKIILNFQGADMKGLRKR